MINPIVLATYLFNKIFSLQKKVIPKSIISPENPTALNLMNLNIMLANLILFFKITHYS